jgi:hypothetical protein
MHSFVAIKCGHELSQISMNLVKAVKMNLILSVFEQLSWLKISFRKSWTLLLAQAKEHEMKYCNFLKQPNIVWKLLAI